MTQALDVAAYLASKGYQGRPAGGGTEIVYPCFLGCGEDASSRKRKLYVNARDGWFHCKVCDIKGGTYLLLQHFGDDPKDKKVGDEHVASRRQILSEATEVAATMLQNNDDVLLYLMNERGLSPETIVERQLGYVGPPWSLVQNLTGTYTREAMATTGLVYPDGHKAGQDFFFRHLLIPYQSRGSVTQVRGRIYPEENWTSGKYWTGSGIDADLYGRSELVDAEDCIIVEGELDAMVLKQHLQSSPDSRLRRMAVVSPPGAGSLKEEWLPYFEDVRRIYLAFDPDDTGKRAMVTYKEMFGSRARIIELPPELPKCDWTEYLLPVPLTADTAWHLEHPHAGHDWRDVARLLANASGRRLFSMAEAGASWRAYKEENPQGIKTGFSQLDAAILPGLLPGQVMIILAKTGTGKTILLCNMAYYMRHEPVMFISLEMTKEEVYERLRRIYLFWYPEATDAEIDMAYDNIMVCDENRLQEKDLELLVEEFQIEKGAKPKVCYIDYLGYFARGARGNSPYEKVSNAVMTLKAMAKAHMFSIISPAQVNRGTTAGKPIDLDDARDAGTIEETADFLVSIWRPDDAIQADGVAQPTGKLRLTTLKSRHGNAGLTFSLQMDMLSLIIVDDATTASKKALEHNHLYWRGKTWDDMRALETAPKQLTLGRP